MKRCGACGIFFDAEECPTDHTDIPGYEPPTTIEQAMDYGTLFVVGNAVTCNCTGYWPELSALPGLIVSYEAGLFRVIVCLPGDPGTTRVVSLPGEALS